MSCKPPSHEDRVARAVREILLNVVGGESVMFVHDIAQQHGLAQSTARKHISSGLYGPPFMLGRRLAVRRADYDAAIRRMAGAEKR